MKKDLEKLKVIIVNELDKFRSSSYQELKSFVVQDKVDVYEITLEGIVYDIEILFFWDNHPNGNIRVIGSINEQRTFSAFRPLSDSFIKAPDGSFIGE